jgi:hypothetical protein
MTSVEDVLSQLKTVIAEIDQAASAVMRAKAHVSGAHAAFNEAGTGTQDTDMRSAISSADAGGKDLRKVAVLLTHAIQDFADYADVIAPGAGIGGRPNDDVMPSGERIIRESEDRRSKFGAFVKTTTQSSDEFGEKAKGIVDFAARVGGRHPGGTATTTVQPAQPPPQPPPTAGDHAGNILVFGLAAAVVAENIRDRLTKWRLKRRGQQPS